MKARLYAVELQVNFFIICIIRFYDIPDEIFKFLLVIIRIIFIFVDCN